MFGSPPFHKCNFSLLHFSSTFLPVLSKSCNPLFYDPRTLILGVSRRRVMFASLATTLLKKKVLHDAIEHNFCLNGSIKTFNIRRTFLFNKRFFVLRKGSSDHKKVRKIWFLSCSSNLPQYICLEVSSLPIKTLITWLRCV